MQQITIDTSTGQQLRQAIEPVEVCDSGGRLLGYFTPIVEASAYRDVSPPSSEEELLRRAAAGGGRT
jgi:hypothetical protein